MLLKEIGRKIAQAFRLARAADEKVASSIAAALDAKAEQIKEYEKRFEPEHPEPEPLPMQQVIQSLRRMDLVQMKQHAQSRKPWHRSLSRCAT